MSKSFKFVDHTADIAVELTGSSLDDLFIAGAEAWYVSVAGQLKTEDDDLVELDLSASSKEELLVNFLNELNYLLLTKKWLCSSILSIKIFDDTDSSELSAELKGINLKDEHQLRQEIKSVTYHQLEIVKSDGNYSTLVVFDI